MTQAPAGTGACSGAPGIGRRTAVTVLLSTLAVQLLLQAWFFPWAALGDSTRLLYIDSGFHHYQMEAARQLCAEGRITGWDPLFGAGQVAGVAVNASAKLQALAACVSGDADSVAPLYKQASFWLGVLAPALLVCAGLLLGLPLAALVLVAALAIISWWTGPLRWYHTAGMVSYVAIAYLAIPFALAAVQVCQRPGWGRATALALLAAVGMWVHPLFPVAATLVGLVWLLIEARQFPSIVRAVSSVVLIAGVMLAVNAVWIGPTLKANVGGSYGIPYQVDVVPTLVLQELLGRARTAAGGSRLGIALLLGAVLCVLCYRGHARRPLLGLVGGSALLMAWASFGAALPSIAALQPNRFSALAWLTLVLPASAGMVAAAQTLQRKTGIARHALGLALVVCVLVTGYFVREVWREFQAPSGAARYAVAPPEVKPPGPTSTAIVDFLQHRTDRSARVFFETSLGRIHDGAHMAGVYALQADREFIGGPYPGTDFASAWDAFAFGKPIGQHEPAALAALLDGYNIRWMLCHSAACRKAMSALPDARQVAALGAVTAYERAVAPGWVLQGSARVAGRCVNRLELTEVAGPVLVLRHHWVPGLVAVPSGRVEPHPVVPGARPFIAIHDPPSQLAIRVGDGPGIACSDRGGHAP